LCRSLWEKKFIWTRGKLWMFTKIQMLEFTYRKHCESTSIKARLLVIKNEKLFTVNLKCSINWMFKLRICYTSQYIFWKFHHQRQRTSRSSRFFVRTAACKVNTSNQFVTCIYLSFWELRSSSNPQTKNLTEVVASDFNISVLVTVENYWPFLVYNPVHVNKASPIPKASRYVLLEYRAVTAYWL